MVLIFFVQCFFIDVFLFVFLVFYQGSTYVFLSCRLGDWKIVLVDFLRGCGEFAWNWKHVYLVSFISRIAWMGFVWNGLVIAFCWGDWFVDSGGGCISWCLKTLKWLPREVEE